MNLVTLNPITSLEEFILHKRRDNTELQIRGDIEDNSNIIELI